MIHINYHSYENTQKRAMAVNAVLEIVKAAAGAGSSTANRSTVEPILEELSAGISAAADAIQVALNKTA